MKRKRAFKCCDDNMANACLVIEFVVPCEASIRRTEVPMAWYDQIVQLPMAIRVI